MKTLLALIFTLSAFSVFAVETESNCAQIADSSDRTSREVASGSESSTATGSASSK